MGQGYVRNDGANNIANGNVIDAADLDGEFDAIVDAFASATGHTHDGTTAEGGAVSVIGPGQDILADATAIYPKTAAVYDLGKVAASFDVAYVESINLAGTAITSTAVEINYTDGVTSAIQTQLDGKLPLSGGTMTGNVTMPALGTVDGRDLSVDGAKLDGIEPGATADQTKADIDALGLAYSSLSGLPTLGSLAALSTVSAATITDNSVGAAELNVTGNGTTAQFLRSDGDGTFTWATPTDTNTVYSHPTHPGDDMSVDTGALTGATVISDLDFNVTTDTLGHVTDANATVSTRNLTLANLGYTGATNANYITNNNQLTNGAGYTTNVGDITGVTAGTNLTGGGSSGSVTVNLTASPNITSLNVGSTEVISSSRELKNIASVDATTAASITAAGVGGGGGSPAGSIIYHAANTPPSGYVKANGASLSTSTYADLFAAIGYTYGGSGGSFNVPDLRGEFMRGWDDSRGVDSGRSFGSAQSWAIENIVGTFTDIRTRLNTVYTTSGAFAGSTGTVSGDNGGGGAATVNFDFDASRVVNTASETRPRNIALLACIKF